MAGRAAMKPSQSYDASTASRLIMVDGAAFQHQFQREPAAFSHGLSELPQFQRHAIDDLAARYDSHRGDYFVSVSAPSAGTEFFSVPHSFCKPSEAINRLDTDTIRLLLKRPENHDRQFRELLDALFAEVMALRPELRRERLVRLESSVFITSAACTTPFHFDPEIAFFFQIEGEKFYHVYAPAALREQDLERFYLQGVVSIGQVDLEACDRSLETIYTLRAGTGFHQPQNSPHWVETSGSTSISYSFVFETNISRAQGMARAYNYYLRKAGVRPQAPGHRPAMDLVKAGTMRMIIPVRQRVSAALKTLRNI